MSRTETRQTTASTSTSSQRSGRSSGAGSTRSTGGRDRFEARRLANERRQGLQRLRWVIGLAAVTSLAVGVVAFINSSLFDVDEIEVSGADRADPADIVAASGLDLGQGLLEVDLPAAVASIELVPWIDTATVNRSWGGTIQIEVTERPPAVAIAAGPRFALVDHHGRQLELVDRRPTGQLPIHGIEGSGVAGEPAPSEILPVIALVEALPAETLDRVAAVAVDGESIELELVGGGLVLLGRGVDLGAKIQAFETLLARVDLTCLDTIDVRVPEAPVVRRTTPLDPLGPSAGSDPSETGDEAAGEEPDSAPVDC